MAKRALPRGTALLLWRRLPNGAARLSGTLRVALRDGDYLLSWPLAAAGAPPLALLIGVLLGAAQPGSVYATSLLVVLVFAALAGLGAALGLYALVGYLLGDLVLHQGTGYPYGGGSAPFADRLLRTDLARLGTWFVLASLVVVAPLVATALRQRSQRLVRPGAERLVLGFALAAVVQAGLAYLWGQAAALLVRPVWSFWDAPTDTGAIDNLQHHGGWIALVTLIAVAGRGALTGLAARHPVAAPRTPWVRFRTPAALPWPMAAVLRAAAGTLLLAGLTGSPLGAALVFALFAGVDVLRYRVVPALHSYPRLVARVPVVLRVAACCLLGYLLGLLVVAPAVDRGTNSFLPVLLALVPPLVLAAFLLPAVPAGSARGIRLPWLGAGLAGSAGSAGPDTAAGPDEAAGPGAAGGPGGTGGPAEARSGQ